MPVTGFDIALRRPVADGRAFGDVGPYEELKGRIRIVVDPTLSANARVTDIEHAPRPVEFAADVSVLLPVERGRANGRVLLDVVNRGNTVAVPNFNHATRPLFVPGADPNPPIDVGDGFLMRHGWVVISCGWQSDVPQIAGLYRLHGLEARATDGSAIRGRVYTQLQAPEDVASFLLSDRGHLAHPAADLDERGAVLLVRDQPDAAPETVPRARWRFSDPTHITMEGGFRKGRIYQIVYTAVGPPVLGLGLVALRDSVSWLKYGTAADGNPAPGVLRYAYAYGRSQTGRLLRTYVWDDLNLDEAGREAIDGIIANVAGGMRGEFNQRFGQNSKDRPHMMSHVTPSTDAELRRRVDARGSRLKIFYTNTSSEYHRGDASLVHTEPDGTRDVAEGPQSRVYHFAGTEHGVGVWPPSDLMPSAADPSGWTERSQNLRGVVNYCRLLRACLVNLDRWVTEGVEPPPSRYPKIADGTALPPEDLHKVFEKIPGSRYLPHHARPRRLDFSTLPPRDGAPFGSLVSAVDDDGNELGGIRLPEITVPLAAHTGWNLRHPDIGGAEQLLVFAGSTLPLPRTRRGREASADPRLSIDERYRSRADYLERIRGAALELVAQRYLLEEDVETSVTFATRLWDWLASGDAARGAGSNLPD